MADKSIFVLGVALITWGGVFLYLLRLAAIAKRLEIELKAHAAQAENSQKMKQNSVPISLS
ncbi:hypothetical protein B1R32_11146 [Abditibacterium utsteinense]|uniref:CcmD family protein n=1 Tax=Abditibacterium utsteinense TaxID=1960156 RepID=A0A2S8SRS5_9BACT|nr:hypothetical protein [Abditibacterium utsteinense]PQV63485.1 hypothetical protein B1R32_11146 [Abditibacterium utsteinense]